jgi:hypothetical protein
MGSAPVPAPRPTTLASCWSTAAVTAGASSGPASLLMMKSPQLMATMENMASTRPVCDPKRKSAAEPLDRFRGRGGPKGGSAMASY